jgi:hypothetical protein
MLLALERSSQSSFQGSLRNLTNRLKSVLTMEPGSRFSYSPVPFHKHDLFWCSESLKLYSKLEIKVCMAIVGQLFLYSENFQDVKKYLPTRKMSDAIASYFCSKHLGLKSVIPIWDPSPIQDTHQLERVRIDVGDVGTITGFGGFRVAYNILMDEETNILCGYSVPPEFSQFVPPKVPGRKRSITIDANVVDLDNCGAFATKKIWSQGNSRPLFSGFTHNYFKSSRKYVQSLTVFYLLSRRFSQGSLQLQISPTKDVGNRGYLHLPHGAKIYSYTNLCHDALEDYLETHLPSWLGHLEKLRLDREAPPILLTSVWVARLFACATYSCLDPKKRHAPSSAELWKVDPKSDKMIWDPVSDGFSTMLAPLDDGFDKEGQIISKREDQCFGIEGYVFPPLRNKALEKTRRQ